jgi:CRISPR/Cas system CMR-associated protein Cmr3 (group 5 of RAMP superfamily)
MLHGSFANTSVDQRISITIGFHRLASVLGQRSALAIEGGDIYDEQRIFKRSAVIAVAIDARAQYFPNETRYCYQPFVGLEEDYRWNDDTFERVIRNYSTKDLAI